MTPRRILFRIRLTAGCVAGVLILVMSVTGVLLAPKPQIIAWADHSFRSQPAPGEQRLRLEELLTAVQAAQERMPSGITVRPESAAPVAFDFGRERTLFVNPYTGQLLGEESPNLRAFFSEQRSLCSESDHEFAPRLELAQHAGILVSCAPLPNRGHGRDHVLRMGEPSSLSHGRG